MSFTFKITPKGLLKLATLLLLGSVLTACAQYNPGYRPAGDHFLWGLLHGFIMPFVMLLKFVGLFAGGMFREFGIYQVYNNGIWYDFGYTLGAFVIFGLFGYANGEEDMKKKIAAEGGL